ncbi:hypothetical protein [Candidatus Borreliella tachyglossi]|uniref:hypothetical protein n=1 Tax=Candidatus Borreliella tachyglossi TaxID=1964448 RepID=UPI004041EE36
MKEVSFKTGLPVNAADLNTIINNFNEYFMAVNSCKIYGRINSGFKISYEAYSRRITVSSGVGFTPSGRLIKLDSNSIYEFDSTYDKSKYVNLLFFRPTSDFKTYNLCTLAYALEGGELDPYSYLKQDEDIYVDYLAIGFYLVGKGWEEFNRARQEPTSPVGGLFFYEKKDFINFITLRGCKLVSKFDGRYVKCASGQAYSSGAFIGGNAELRLSTNNIPTLKVTGKTSEAGRHTHGYISYKTYRKDNPEIKDASGYNNKLMIREYDENYTTNYSGEHSHTIYTLKYENNSQSSIKLTPSYKNLALIERIY